MAWTSYTLNDVSQGLVPIRLWIPQSAMASGCGSCCSRSSTTCWPRYAGGDAVLRSLKPQTRGDGSGLRTLAWSRMALWVESLVLLGVLAGFLICGVWIGVDAAVPSASSRWSRSPTRRPGR